MIHRNPRPIARGVQHCHAVHETSQARANRDVSNLRPEFPCVGYDVSRRDQLHESDTVNRSPGISIASFPWKRSVRQPSVDSIGKVQIERPASRGVGIPCVGPEDRDMAGDSNYRFGAFELLVHRQLLTHAGTPVHIGSRALALLTVLVESAGELVTKEKLIAAAWPTTFVDDSNLKVNIANLRRTLASTDPGQDYIATVPGRGYRFVAPVHRIWIG